MVLLEWEVIIFLEAAKYLIGYVISQRETSIKPKKQWMIAGLILSVVPVIFYRFTTPDIRDAYLGFWLVTMLALMWVMDGSLISRFWHTFIIFLCISSLDGINEGLIDLIDVLSGISSEVKMMLMGLISATALLIVLVLKRIVIKAFPAHQDYIGVLLTQMAIIFSGVCQCLGATIIVDELSDYKPYYAVGLFSYLGVALLASQIWVIVNLYSRVKSLLKEERILHVTQRDYYQSLLDREEETRKYRHDMANHMLVMNALLKEDNIDELKEYLGNLQEEFATVQTRRYFTGNPIIDAISGYYLPNVEGFTDIRVVGVMSPDLSVNEVSICTIYSNLIKNAVEELQRLKEDAREHLKLFIEFKSGKDFLKISIKNTMRENTLFRGIDTPTSKVNSKNHGIGLGNVKRTVEKEHGKLVVEKEDQMFCAYVLLPNS